MYERQEERLETSLEREGAGGGLCSALPLATEGTQECRIKLACYAEPKPELAM